MANHGLGMGGPVADTSKLCLSIAVDGIGGFLGALTKTPARCRLLGPMTSQFDVLLAFVSRGGRRRWSIRRSSALPWR
jgi:hypothetical protein